MTLRRLGWAAALGLIVALASVVFYGAGKTHICPVYLWVSFDDHEAITTLSPGGLLFGERMAAPPGRHRPSRGPLRLPRLRGAAEGRRCAAIIAGASCTGRVCKAHLCVSFFLKRALFLQVWRLRPGGCGCWTVAGRALGCCCGGVLRGQCWDIVAAGPSGVHKLSRHTPRSRPLFLEFSSSVDLPVVLSLLYCLPSTKDFVCSLRLSLVYR